MSILLYNPIMDIIESRNNFRYSNSYYRPATDVYESKDEIVIKMDLPGVKRENIAIEATFNELEIQSRISDKTAQTTEAENVQTEQKEEFNSKLFSERSQKNFYRKFKFNKPVNPQEAKVNLEDGVLTITLPLRPEAKKINLTIN